MSIEAAAAAAAAAATVLGTGVDGVDGVTLGWLISDVDKQIECEEGVAGSVRLLELAVNVDDVAWVVVSSVVVLSPRSWRRGNTGDFRRALFIPDEDPWESNVFFLQEHDNFIQFGVSFFTYCMS